MDKTKLALVGCGWMGDRHSDRYRQLYEKGCREFVVTACCDRDAKKANELAGKISAFQGATPQVFAEPEQLAAAAVADAADVCVPHCFHHSAATPLLAAGLHVQVEKPIGITIKASKAIIEAARKNSRILATAENTRRCLSSRACRWAVAEAGLIGRPMAGDVMSIRYSPFPIDDPKFKWRSVKALTGGGMIMDSGAHFADMMIHLFGEVEDVFCLMETREPLPIKGAPVVGDVVSDVEDSWHAVIRFRSGMRVAWTYSRAYPNVSTTLAQYYGTDGTIFDSGAFHPFEAGGNVVKRNGDKISREQIEAQYMASLSDEQKEKLFPYGLTDGFAVEIMDFIRAVRTGTRPEMDGWDGLRSKTLCMTCYESAVAGKPVKYDDVLSGATHAYQDPIDEFWGIK